MLVSQAIGITETLYLYELESSVYSDQLSNLLQSSVMCVHCDQEHPEMFTYGISLQVK